MLQIGSWPAPFGITLVADLFSALHGGDGRHHWRGGDRASSFSGVDPRREAFGYHALIHVLLMGVSGAFLTGDIFNLYVWFEVMLIASFVLMSLHRTRAQLHAAFTYVGLNLLASAFLLTAIGLLYGQAGTLNFADLARAWPERRTPGLDAALSMLFLTAFGIKAGLFPLFFWLPASYHTPPAAVGALLAGLLTKVGVYAMIRVFTLLFPDPTASVYTVAAGDVGRHDGRWPDRRARPARFPSCPLLQSGRSYRLHHRRSGVVDASFPGRFDPLRAASHARDLDALPREWAVPAAEAHDRPARAGGPLSDAAVCGVSRDGPAVLSGGNTSAVWIPGEAGRGGADDWPATVCACGDRTDGESADRALDGAASGKRRSGSQRPIMPRSRLTSRVLVGRFSRLWRYW